MQARGDAYSENWHENLARVKDPRIRDLAELEAGQDILQEAFGNYQADLAARRPMSSALRNLCQVLARGSGVWGQELNRVSGWLRVG